MILIDGFEIDAALSEEHTFDSEVTEHPVEKGADISDHVRARPIEVTIDGVVSDTPIGSLAQRRTGVPSSDAFARLMQIRDAREPITIQTSLKTFENMILQSLSAPRDSSTGDAFRFRASFIQVQLVTNERTTVVVAQPRGAKKVNLGNRPTTFLGARFSNGTFLGVSVPSRAPAVRLARSPVRQVKSPTIPTEKIPDGSVYRFPFDSSRSRT